jgi:hypothetical protein
MYTTDQQIGDVIAQVNVVRMAMGYPLISELPSATRGHRTDCLFYRALSDVGVKDVTGGALRFASERQAALAAELWGTSHEGDCVKPPTQMRRTISQFDDAQFEHYFATSNV